MQGEMVNGLQCNFTVDLRGEDSLCVLALQRNF